MDIFEKLMFLMDISIQIITKVWINFLNFYQLKCRFNDFFFDNSMTLRMKNLFYIRYISTQELLWYWHCKLFLSSSMFSAIKIKINLWWINFFRHFKLPTCFCIAFTHQIISYFKFYDHKVLCSFLFHIH